jgi:hypothetical protein
MPADLARSPSQGSQGGGAGHEAPDAEQSLDAAEVLGALELERREVAVHVDGRRVDHA